MSLKTYKISEQQENPKVLSVANSCHYNENFKNGKHRLQTNACPSRATPTNPHPPQAKVWMQKSQGGGKFLVQFPGVRGGMVMDEIDTCIIQWEKAPVCI